MKGQLSERPFVEVLSELSRTRANGILKVVRDKQTKALFLEEGNPVMALSSAPEDQLGDMLIREGRLSAEQLASLGQADSLQQLAQKLAESNLISVNDLESAMQRLTTNVILSLNDWQNGEFSFEKKDARITMAGKLQKPAANLILASARKIQDLAVVRAPFLDSSCVLKPLPNSPQLLNQIALEQFEGYILSRITEPTPLQTAFSLIGLPEQQTMQCLYGLVMAGLLQLEGGAPKPKTASAPARPSNSGPSAPPSKPADSAPPKADGGKAGDGEIDEAKFQQEVVRMLAFFASADYYEILGVTRKAAEGDIKKSYYQLAKKYHPDRAHKSSSADLKTGLEKVFAKITEAYEKLKDADQRKLYDDKIRGKPEQRSSAPPPQPRQNTPPPNRPAPAPTPPPAPAPPPPAPAQVNRPAPQSASSPAQQSPAAQASAPASRPATGPLTAQSSAAPAGKATAANVAKTTAAKTPEMAVENFNQGKQALARGDMTRAVYLFREAVQISGDNKEYRQQLVMALMKNPKWYKEAEDHLNKLVELDSTNANNHALLGVIYKAANMNARAAAKFKEALALDPKNKVALRETGAGEGKAAGSGKSLKDMDPKELWGSLSTPIKIGLVIVLLAVGYFVYGMIFPPPPPPPPPKAAASASPSPSPAASAKPAPPIQ